MIQLMVAHLSKSKIISGLQCLRRLWLEKNRPDLLVITPATERVFRMGHQLNDLVHTLYPEGILIEHDRDLPRALKETRYLLATKPDHSLFEATISKHNVLIRADMLEKTQTGFHLTEVKSSTKVKPYHLSDCAIQTWVLREAGLPVSQVTLAHIDNQFVYPGGGNYQGILAHEDVTAHVEPLLAEVPDWVADCHSVLEEPQEPKIIPGKQCAHPFDCPFVAHCSPAVAEYPVESLPRISPELVEQLHAEGIYDIRDIPFGRLKNETQEWVRTVTNSGKEDLKPELTTALRALPYPRYYIDFETIQFAIPIWKGTRPYEQLPFQWSCHIEHEGGTVEHLAFLDISGEPPMRSFTESLIKAVGQQGPVLVYSHFERTTLTSLAERFPDLKASLNAIIDREYDLLKAIRANYYHPDMHGSWSIKAVLPVVVGDTGYEDLEEVKDGISAQIAFDEAIEANTATERKAQIEQSLLEYCKLDTWAMVELVRNFSQPDCMEK